MSIKKSVWVRSMILVLLGIVPILLISCGSSSDPTSAPTSANVSLSVQNPNGCPMSVLLGSYAAGFPTTGTATWSNVPNGVYAVKLTESGYSIVSGSMTISGVASAINVTYSGTGCGTSSYWEMTW